MSFVDTIFNGALSKEKSVAEPGYSRWKMSSAAVKKHLALGSVYGFSVFNAGLAALLGKGLGPMDLVAFYGLQGLGLMIAFYSLLLPKFGKAGSVVGGAAIGASITALIVYLVGGSPSALTQVGGIFSTAIIFLGASSALFGEWVERVGVRKAMAASAVCFLSGLLIAALGTSIGSLALIQLGYGAIGGVGLGIGYISPVSTLIKWFPDKKGMATGIAICGFGGAALFASAFAVFLMKHFAEGSSTSGIAETFLAMAAVYSVLHASAIFTARAPFPGYQPKGWTPPADEAADIAANTVSGHTVSEAIVTGAFWLIFAILFTNVAAGIGILGQAALMAQKMVGVTPAQGAGFVGALSLANMLGRFVWSSLSDKIGRFWAYAMYTGVGAAAYFAIPGAASAHNLPLFAGLFILVLSFYGAGFSTVPAYLADKFGKKAIGAIHGRLLVAWSLAGVVGPLLVNAGRDHLVKTLHVVDGAAYSTVCSYLGYLLLVGFAANLALLALARFQPASK